MTVCKALSRLDWLDAGFFWFGWEGLRGCVYSPGDGISVKMEVVLMKSSYMSLLLVTLYNIHGLSVVQCKPGCQLYKTT